MPTLALVSRIMLDVEEGRLVLASTGSKLHLSRGGNAPLCHAQGYDMSRFLSLHELASRGIDARLCRNCRARLAKMPLRAD